MLVAVCRKGLEQDRTRYVLAQSGDEMPVSSRKGLVWKLLGGQISQTATYLFLLCVIGRLFRLFQASDKITL